MPKNIRSLIVKKSLHMGAPSASFSSGFFRA
jgi:hypothetical protein